MFMCLCLASSIFIMSFQQNIFDKENKTMESGENSDRAKELKQFDETKAGVKGLLDSGPLINIPTIFINPEFKLENHNNSNHPNPDEISVIDLEGIDEKVGRKKIVDELCKAAETSGFFQIVNHGIPVSVMEEFVEVIRRFHEQPTAEKKSWYSRDVSRKFRFYCNAGLQVSKPVDWRDTVCFRFEEENLDFQELPPLCRKETKEYTKWMIRVKEKISELLSEALGLSGDYLKRMGCMKSAALSGHYYPVCPNPESTLGATSHSDPCFLTILLIQHNTPGLQLFLDHKWLDAVLVPGALLVNIGDLLQLISNDKFKSVRHRVLAMQATSRISAACFFNHVDRRKPFGPVRELLSPTNPPIYRETHVTEFYDHYVSLGYTSPLPHFKL